MPRTFDQFLAGLATLKAEDFDYHTPGPNGLPIEQRLIIITVSFE